MNSTSEITPLVLQALPILGLGSLMTLLVQNWMKRKERFADRLFEEKREAFVGLLKAMGDHVAQNTLETISELGYWRMRCEIVSSKPTRRAIAYRLDEGHLDLGAHEKMLKQMRTELGIST